jgi:hypothetical protein
MGVEQRRSRTLERTSEFRDAVLRIGEEWKGREGDQAGTETGMGMATEDTTGDGSAERSGVRKRWKIQTINLWEAMVDSAGGEGDELAPYLR